MAINKSVFNFMNIGSIHLNVNFLVRVDEGVFKAKEVFHRKPKKQCYTFLIEEVIKPRILLRQQGMLMEKL